MIEFIFFLFSTPAVDGPRVEQICSMLQGVYAKRFLVSFETRRGTKKRLNGSD